MTMPRTASHAFFKNMAWPWIAICIGSFVLLISYAHVPADWDALNHFDPPKRLLWALLALVLGGAWSAGKSRLGRGPMLLSLGLLAWMVVRTLLKPRPDVELEVLFTWTLPLLLFILATCLNNKRGAKYFGWMLVMACLIQAGLMVMQRSGIDPLFFDTTSAMDYKPGRMVGTIGYHNQAVDFLALSSVGILLVSRQLWIRMAFIGGMLLVAGLTGNRGGVLALTLALLVAVVCSVALFDTWNKRKKWMVVSAVILGLVGMWSVMARIPETGSRFREMAVDFNRSPAVETRALMARVGMDMLREKPLMGWGAGEYAFQFLDRLGGILPRVKTQAVLGRVVFAREAHNDLLQFVVEFGMVGALLLAALVGTALTSVKRAQWMGRASGIGIAFVLAYMAVSSLFSFPWQTSMGGPLAGLLLGWLWPSGGKGDQGDIEERCGTPRPVWAISIQAGLVGMSMVLVGWFALAAFLNMAVPHSLVADGPAATERLLPRFAYCYHALVGAAYASQSDYVEAEKSLVHAERGYRDIPLWNNLGHVFGKTGKWDEARQVYERWERCGLEYSEAMSNLSIAYEQIGRWGDAADMLTHSISLWRNPSPEEIKRLAVLQLQSGNPHEAEKTLRQFWPKWYAADPKTVAEIENLGGAIYLVLGDKQEAAKWFRAALGLNPDLVSAKRNLDGLSTMPAGDSSPLH